MEEELTQAQEVSEMQPTISAGEVPGNPENLNGKDTPQESVEVSDEKDVKPIAESASEQSTLEKIE